MTDLKLFFATDVHGSEICFRKFINAGKAYQADILIMGGDITGKMIVPIIETGKKKFSFQWLGASYQQIEESDLEGFLHQMRMSGCYPIQTNPDEIAQLEADPSKVKALFRRAMKESIQCWLGLAEERLRGSGIECYITPGNDDDLALDEVFSSQTAICNPERQVVHLKGEIEMISSGYSNRTPWHSPREMDEDDLWSAIQTMADHLVQPQRAIFNFHCPPYDVGLDLAPRLDKTLKPIAGIGGVESAPVGSTAVLKAIQTYHPMLGLHGHVHESRGAVRVGKTLCVNPGSEYTEGILRGCLILLDKKGVRDYLLTAG